MGKSKILWQSSTPISGLPAYSDAIRKHAKNILGPDYELEIKGVDRGSLDLHYNYVQYLNDYNILNNILRAEAEGFEAVAIGCFFDPVLKEAREVANIPVVSLAETGMLYACMYGQKFSVVTYQKQVIRKKYDQLVNLYGLQSRSVAGEYFDISLNVLANSFTNPKPVLDAFLEAGRRAVKNGAEVILPGCGLLNLIVVQNKLTEIDGATVLDVSGALMKTAEAMITLKKVSGIGMTRAGLYESPCRKVLDAANDIYGVKV
ncbi:MAG: aspartate/glutamate racemase family protein [Desulfobacteria bacterium]